MCPTAPRSYTLPMSPARPEAIDSRLVFHVYASTMLPLGIVMYMWPLVLPMNGMLPATIVRIRVTAAVIAALGCCASAFAAVDDPLGRRRGLLGFAHAHLMLGAMLGIQAWARYSPEAAPSSVVAWAALIAGVVLLYLGITGPGSDPAGPLRMPFADGPAGERGLMLRNKRSLRRLRSDYENQIRNAARQEERARLARDLHDAVKQQLFVIQTAGATAQARFDADPPGARAAVEQVRSAAREAMTEMEAMLDQLQAAPITNAGLIAFLRKQCEAVSFRTGAAIAFEPGTMPDEEALDPGARQAVARVAQEALSNVARHARARHVKVALGMSGALLVLKVRDDGSGLAEGRSTGMGMAGMAARAAEVGADLVVTSAPGEGTTVRLTVLCRPMPDAGPYLVRLAASGLLLIVTALLANRFGGFRPLAFTIVLIAAIAVARDTYALWGLTRPRS